MWSIRMRASKAGWHISGAEGLYGKADILEVIKKYASRALSHPKGTPDEIVITAEHINEQPIIISSLPISTLKCSSHKEAATCIRAILKAHGISDESIRRAFEILKSPGNMRGAALLGKKSGARLDADRARGVRASRLGIKKKALRALSERLSRSGINTDTVKEALILASKVSSSKGVTLELCISDDPDYTTGYVASKKIGYLRIPYIKKKGSRSGGRVFFLDDKADTKSTVEYLEGKPAIIGKISPLKGIIPIHEILYSLDSKSRSEKGLGEKDKGSLKGYRKKRAFS